MTREYNAEQFEKDLEKVFSDMKQFLIAKNRKYGDSALSPLRVFSKASASEQIRVRMDDKLSRLISAQGDEDEDPLNDLFGYLVLDKIAKLREQKDIPIQDTCPDIGRAIVQNIKDLFFVIFDPVAKMYYCGSSVDNYEPSNWNRIDALSYNWGSVGLGNQAIARFRGQVGVVNVKEFLPSPPLLACNGQVVIFSYHGMYVIQRLSDKKYANRQVKSMTTSPWIMGKLEWVSYIVNATKFFDNKAAMEEINLPSFSI